MKNRTKWILWSVAIILIIVAIFFGLQCSGCGKKATQPKPAETASYSDSAAYYKGLYMGSQQKEQELLARCDKKKSTPNYAPSTRTRIVTKYVPQPTGTQKQVTTAPNQFTPTKTPSGNTYTTSLGTNSYIGMQDGDFWTTIDEQGNLMYAFRKNLVADSPGGDYRLNSAAGKKFELEGDIYVCHTSQKVNDENLKKIFKWTIYIGNAKGYPAFLPHEYIKYAIEEVRGTTSGRITSDDVKNIGKIVPEVRAGRVTPNGVYVRASDGEEYGGWQFVTTILYKSK